MHELCTDDLLQARHCILPEEGWPGTGWIRVEALLFR
jgi:hypothetical protein